MFCSAGCGRTGTLLAIDYVWNLLKSNTLSDEISVLSILVEMRKQRQSLVQTRVSKQYYWSISIIWFSCMFGFDIG